MNMNKELRLVDETNLTNIFVFATETHQFRSLHTRNRNQYFHKLDLKTNKSCIIHITDLSEDENIILKNLRKLPIYLAQDRTRVSADIIFLRQQEDKDNAVTLEFQHLLYPIWLEDGIDSRAYKLPNIIQTFLPLEKMYKCSVHSFAKSMVARKPTEGDVPLKITGYIYSYLKSPWLQLDSIEWQSGAYNFGSFIHEIKIEMKNMF